MPMKPGEGMTHRKTKSGRYVRVDAKTGKRVGNKTRRGKAARKWRQEQHMSRERSLKAKVGAADRKKRLANAARNAKRNARRKGAKRKAA